MAESSELAILVETESRLDQAIASARKTAEAMRDAARARAKLAEATIEDALANERERIARTIALETTERARQVDADARICVERYERVRDDVFDALARRLAKRLVAIAEEES